MALINFYNETVGFIESLGYRVEDIDFCQIIRSNYSDDSTKIYQFSVEDFKRNANFFYDDETEIIDRTLKIVFKDSSWIERALIIGDSIGNFIFVLRNQMI